MALTDRQAKALQPGDRPVFDGKITGLMLTPGKTDSKWTLRFTSPITGKRRDAGLGVYPEVSIADAREKALTMRKLIDGGADPIDARNREQQAASVAAAALTFEKAARELHGELKPGWKNAKRERQPAMPWRNIPAFAKAQLRDIERGDNTRAALLFAILSGARSGKVRGATWGEFDFDAAIWTVPGERMKAKVPHRVPLSSAALALVKRLKEEKQHETLVFPSPRGKVLSDMTLTVLLRRVNAKSDTTERVATAHGFRSAFRDRASENGYARDLAERALAHTVANKVEATYHRTDLLEQRRPIMEAWAAHVCGD